MKKRPRNSIFSLLYIGKKTKVKGDGNVSESGGSKIDIHTSGTHDLVKHLMSEMYNLRDRNKELSDENRYLRQEMKSILEDRTEGYIRLGNLLQTVSELRMRILNGGKIPSNENLDEVGPKNFRDKK